MALNILTAISAFRETQRLEKYESHMDELDAANELLSLIWEEARAQKWMLYRSEIALRNSLALSLAQMHHLDDAKQIRYTAEVLKRIAATMEKLKQNRVARAQHIRHNITGDRRTSPRKKGL